ncbi:TPA: hypothetical protein I7247_22145 [Vibrio vulnificus]|nr:hypothetical protein [Vibrio vulnificus]HDY7603714.1 hypothetical protein [Vibrio vulnificus]
MNKIKVLLLLLLPNLTFANEPDVTWFGDWGMLKSSPREGFYPRNLIGFSKDGDLKLKYYCASDSKSGFKKSSLSLLLQDEMVVVGRTYVTVHYETDIDKGNFLVTDVSAHDKKTVNLENLHLWETLKKSVKVRFSLEGYDADARNQTFKFKYMDIDLKDFNYAVSETNKSCRL